MNRVVIKPKDKDKFELVESYEYKDIKIPKGYITNGANIPRIFWSIFPPNSPEYLSAIVVHDFLTDKAESNYRLVCSCRDNSPHERHSQTNDTTLKIDSFKNADLVLKEMMSELGCSKFKIYCFYYSCRVYHILKYKGKGC